METQLQNPGIATGILRRITLSYRAGALLVLLVALFTHLPTSFGDFSTDDFLIRAMTAGDPALHQLGFAKADPDKSFWVALIDGFHFFSPEAGSLPFYRDYGNLPWWTADNATMNPLRPVSAFTHWLDNRIAPGVFEWQALHTLLYILLFAWSGYRLFWRISPSPSVAILASLMLVVDFSHLLNFNWIAARNVFIAGALGCAALEQFLAWREERSRQALALSLALFVVGLVSAESSIALGAYLLAYLLLVERRGLRATALALLPYALIVLTWRLAYNLGGFGADDIGLYVDPGHSLKDFLLSALEVVPVLLASCITTADGALTGASPELQPWLVAGCGLLALGCATLIWPVIKARPRMQFMLAGSVMAAIPAAALISAGPRGGLFVSIGFFWILAMWLHWLVAPPRRSRFNRGLLGAILCLHLFLPALSGFLLTSKLLPVAYASNGQFSSVAKSFQPGGERRSLVIVNSHAPNTAFYLPFEWSFQNGVTPQSMNLLAPGLVTFDLTRLSAREFELVAPMGLPLNHTQPLQSLDGDHPMLSSAYSLQLLQGLFTSPQTRIQEGFQRTGGEMRVTVKALVDGRPSRLRIQFIGREQPDDMAWQWYDWSRREYRSLTIPAIGETLRFAGPFDSKVKSAVKLCVNCEN